MKELRKVKIPKELSDYISKSINDKKNKTELTTNEEVLKILGIENEKDIEANDYFQFIRFFGNDIELYKKLKHLKEDTKMSWEDISKLKWGDIDFENNTIMIKQKIAKRDIKKGKEYEI